MNYVKQAFELDDNKKQLALELYKKALTEMAHKNYVMRVDDAHTELSAIFGVEWIAQNSRCATSFFDRALYAEANVAFNYANFRLSTNGRIIKLKKDLITKNCIVGDKTLNKYAKQMDFLLTATTAEKITLS